MVELLEKVKLFAGLDDEQLAKLGNCVEIRQVPAGIALVKEGEPLSSLFILIEGRVQLNVRDDLARQVVLDVVEAGEVFGELSLVTDEPAFIWAKTLSASKIGVLDRDDFHQFLTEHPRASLEVFQVLGRRTVRLEYAVHGRRSRDVNELQEERLSFGERVSDWFADLIGSWPFIITQSLVLASWVALNVVGWVKAWDPYPFILLNLALSFQAAYAGPIIMMSQNRQENKDRLAASVDHQVNLKAEMQLSLLFRRIEDLEDSIEKLKSA